jgi:GNAT superfamily N-acetyltransferase
MINIIHAETPEQLALIHGLFREYQEFLGVDLCFQNFAQELAGLPGKYAPPKGRLLLAMSDSTAVGCVALKELDDDGVCEMKRLFVKPVYRSHGLGKRLIEMIIDEARCIGYQRMRLDTLHSLEKAMSLYQLFGFKSIEAYYFNPLADPVYWELDLAQNS